MTQNNSHDQQLLDQAKRALAGEVTENKLVNDLATTRTQVDPVFQQQLEDHLITQLEVGLLELRSKAQVDSTGDSPQDLNRSSEKEMKMSLKVLPLPRRQEPPLQGLLVATVAVVVMITFGIVALGNLLRNPTNLATVFVDKTTLFERYVETVWNEGNLDTLSLFVTDDHIHHDANLAEDLAGIEAVTEYIATNRAYLPGLVLEVNQLTTDGDNVSGELTASANDKTVTVRVNGRFIDDKLAEIWFNVSDVVAALALSVTAQETDAVCPIEGLDRLDDYPAVQFWFRGYAQCYSGAELRTACDKFATEEVMQRDPASSYTGCPNLRGDILTNHFPGVSITIDDTIIENDKVFVRSTWTYPGPYSGIKESIETAAQFTLVDGQLNTIWFLFDFCATDGVETCIFR